MIIIPDEIIVGFQAKRNWGYTKDLGFATFIDNKGKFRKETSWNQWCSDKNRVLKEKNVPVAGFRLSDTTKRSSEWFGSGKNMWRVTDPRGFILEIDSPNLQCILDYCHINEGEIEESCVWAWDGAHMSLIPTNSEIFEEAFDNTDRTKKKIALKDVKPGYRVELENGMIGEFCGGFSVLTKDAGYHASLKDGKQFKVVRRYLLKKDDNTFELFSTIKISTIIKKTLVDNKKYEDEFNTLIHKYNIRNFDDTWYDKFNGMNKTTTGGLIIFISTKPIKMKNLSLTKVPGTIDRLLEEYDWKKRSAQMAEWKGNIVVVDHSTSYHKKNDWKAETITDVQLTDDNLYLTFNKQQNMYRYSRGVDSWSNIRTDIAESDLRQMKFFRFALEYNDVKYPIIP